MEQFPDDYECEGQIDIWEWMEEKETQSMTREKRAIKVLIDVQSQFQASLDEVDVDRDCKEAEEDNTEVVNALEMAIKALEQEPKTECSCEQIKRERDTAIAQLKELGYGLGEKPKTGHWIVHEDCEGKTRYCVCDLCGYETDKYTWRNPNYCPDCGAIMIES